MTKRRVGLRGALSMVAALVLVLAMTVPAFAEARTEGNFQYEVADQSVTIVGYDGGNQTVSVPAMIEGNPVNTLASGSFASSAGVTTVKVPDTVVNIESGALAQGQTLVRKNGSEDDDAQASGVGVRTENGSLVAVDDDGHLVCIGANGVERVLDDSATYTKEIDGSGTMTIKCEDGRTVSVENGNVVAYEAKNGDKIEVDAVTGVTKRSDGKGNTATLEDSTANNAAIEGEEAKSSVLPMAAFIALGVVAAGVVAALLVRRLRKGVSEKTEVGGLSDGRKTAASGC